MFGTCYIPSNTLRQKVQLCAFGGAQSGKDSIPHLAMQSLQQ